MTNFEEAVAADKVFAGLSKTDSIAAQEEITDLTTEIINAFDEAGDSIPTGLLYGKIQSGKTRNMILTAAQAIDRKFKVVVILTSNNNDLVRQTYDAFKAGLPSVKVISKAELNDMDGEIDMLKETLPGDGKSVVIVCSKGQAVLDKVITFLKSIDAAKLPALIFDDEGDQATLDTNTGQRSRTDEAIEPSRIYSMIHSTELRSLKLALPKAIFVSVTGTPQALFLQNIDSKSRPKFVRLIRSGKGYVGGDVFFSTANPDSNKYISIVEEDEVGILLDEHEAIPSGLSGAIDYFIVSATMAGLDKGWSGYNMLAHPSLGRFDHSLVKRKIADYINELLRTLSDPQSAEYATTITRLKKIYDEVRSRSAKTPSYGFDDVVDTISRTLMQRQIFVMNSDRRGPDQSPSRSYNFLIGGNSVGRGLAIENLLVTYYTRSTKVARMDTMHQHARMFGYRQKTLQYTKVFLPLSLYTRFYGIHKSDHDIREFIDTNGDRLSSILVPTNRSYGLSPTRNNVIDMSNVEIILPGSQLYPNRPIYQPPQAITIRRKTEKILKANFPGYKNPEVGRDGIEISTDVALELVSAIKTESKTSWNDKYVGDYLKFLKEKYGSKVYLRYREAPNRANPGGGILPSGVIGGAEQKDARQLRMPTLWVFLVKGSKEKLNWAGVDFVYPTLVVPNQDESLYGNIS